MYKTKKMTDTADINKPTAIYELNCKHNKKYVGKTTDVERRMNQHFSGRGSKVTQKFKPLNGQIVGVVPGYLSSQAEQQHTKYCVKKYGYKNVRGGKWVNSKTLHKASNKTPVCYKCKQRGHYANQCWK